MRGLQDQPAPASDLLAQLLETVGVPAAQLPDDVGDRSALWRGATALRGIVLVLDDARDEAHVRPLLPGAAGRAIVSSRATLAGLEARLAVLEVLEPPASRELLVDSTGDDRIEQSPDAATELGELCGRLPLGGHEQDTDGVGRERLLDRRPVVAVLAVQGRGAYAEPVRRSYLIAHERQQRAHEDGRAAVPLT